eukprot:1160321-Pelagomonas_calceolata.AAC.8
MRRGFLDIRHLMLKGYAWRHGEQVGPAGDECMCVSLLCTMEERRHEGATTCNSHQGYERAKNLLIQSL